MRGFADRVAGWELCSSGQREKDVAGGLVLRGRQQQRVVRLHEREVDYKKQTYWANLWRAGWQECR